MNILRWFFFALFSGGVPFIYAGTLMDHNYYLTPAKRHDVVDTLKVQGNVTVMLKKGDRPQIIVPPHFPHFVSARFSDHTLYINGVLNRPTDHFSKITVLIPSFHRLVVSGAANVIADDFQIRGLSIFSVGTGEVRLNGNGITVDRIEQLGNNHIFLRWVDSNSLTIISNAGGRIYLAGVAKSVHARLKGSAVLNAKYLRVADMHVKAQNNSSAYVSPLSNLRAFSSEKANIYYYTSPQNLTRSTEDSGNVLRIAPYGEGFRSQIN